MDQTKVLRLQVGESSQLKFQWIIQLKEKSLSFFKCIHSFNFQLIQTLSNRLEQTLGAPSLPEMFFSKNTLEFKHIQSGCSLSFNGLEALKSWLHNNTAPKFQVANSDGWSRERYSSINILM